MSPHIPPTGTRQINKASGGHGDGMAQSHHLCMNYRFGASQAFGTGTPGLVVAKTKGREVSYETVDITVAITVYYVLLTIYYHCILRIVYYILFIEHLLCVRECGEHFSFITSFYLPNNPLTKVF